MVQYLLSVDDCKNPQQLTRQINNQLAKKSV